MCLWNLSHLCDVTHGSPFKDLVPYPIFHGVPLSGEVKLAPAAPPALGSPDSKFGIVPMGSGCHQGLCPMGSQSALSFWWGPENPSLVLLFSRETSSPTSARFTRTGRDHTCLPLHLKGALSHMHPGSGSASSTCKLAPASLTSYLVSKSVWLRGTPTGLCLLTALDNHQPHTQPCPCSSAAFPVLCFPYLFAPSSISLYIVFVVCLLLLECKLHAGRALCFVHYGIPSAYWVHQTIDAQ